MSCIVGEDWVPTPSSVRHGTASCELVALPQRICQCPSVSYWVVLTRQPKRFCFCLHGYCGLTTGDHLWIVESCKMPICIKFPVDCQVATPVKFTKKYEFMITRKCKPIRPHINTWSDHCHINAAKSTKCFQCFFQCDFRFFKRKIWLNCKKS